MSQKHVEDIKEFKRHKVPPDIDDKEINNISWNDLMVDQDLLWEDQEQSEVRSNKQTVIHVDIYGVKLNVLLDTGAQISRF